MQEKGTVVCDVCKKVPQGELTERRLYSARREEKRKDATWSTSRVVLHLDDMRVERVLVCEACRKKALWFYLWPVLTAGFAVLLTVIWFFVAPLWAPLMQPVHRVWPLLLAAIAILSVRPYLRKKAGSPDANLAENPLQLFSLDFYLVTRLMEAHRDRIYWTPKWFKRYSDKFQ